MNDQHPDSGGGGESAPPGKGKRAYTMSPEALAQRRAAQPAAVAAGTMAGLSTGPVTEQGKAAVSRNAWKHGRFSAANQQRFGLGAASLAKMFAKPCLTSCPFHPDNPDRDESPCGLVRDGLTRAGGNCLDKTVYVHALDALMGAMKDGDMDGMHGVLANEIASNLHILDQVRQAIAEHGVVTPVYECTKEGEVVIDPRSEEPSPMVFDLKPNPLLPVLIQMTDKLGINFGELLTTPRSRKQADADETKSDALHMLMGGLAQRAAKVRPRLPAPEDS